jgi:hypothetical protein
MLGGYSTGRRANARRAAHLKVFWFLFSKKEPLRFGFQKRTASLWFPKKNRVALVSKKEPLRFGLKKSFY